MSERSDQTTTPSSGDDHPGALADADTDRHLARRYGPIGAVMALVAALVGVSFLGNDDPEPTSSADRAPTATAEGELPDGVTTWSMAEQQGLDVEWPDTCDTETGQVARVVVARGGCRRLIAPLAHGACPAGMVGPDRLAARSSSPM